MQIFTSIFLHDDLLQLAQKSRVGQCSNFFLQCLPYPWVFPTCSGISRYRDGAQNSPQRAESHKPFTPSMIQDMVQSGHKSRVEQSWVCSKTYQNLSPI